MDAGSKLTGIEPEVWFLIFKKKTPLWWLRWLAMGRFKHVLALGWVSSQKVWLVYEVALNGTTVAVLPDSPSANLAIEEMRADSVTLALVPKVKKRPQFWFAFWCAPAIAHLVGVRCALRPDGLFSECIRNNAELVQWDL